MESLLDLLVPLIRLVCTIVLIFLFFFFVVRPLLNYFIVSREIEFRRKLREELPPDLEVDVGGLESRGQRRGEVEEEDVPAPAPPPRQGLSDREALNRLATSDPDKAGDLIKQWVHTDSSR